MTGLTVMDYRPSAELDAEVATVVYQAVRGWPDHGPVTAPLVRSALRPSGTAGTSLVLHRDGDGSLCAVAAIRWPETLESVGRVWGPLVDPSARGHGIARDMLDMITKVVASRPGVRVRTAPIPESRTKGWALYESAGWIGSGTSRLLTRPLTEPPATPGQTHTPATAPVRAARPGEYLDQALASLFAAARPGAGYATARDTYQRWATDIRYVPDGLLLTEDEQGLTGAALVYSSAHRSEPGPSSREYFSRATRGRAAGASQPDPVVAGPSEALLADLITAPDLTAEAAEAVRAGLVRAALEAGRGAGAELARAETDCPFLTATLQAAGFEVADQFRYYTPPTP